MKVKTGSENRVQAYSVSTVALRPKMPIDRMFTVAQLVNVMTVDLELSLGPLEGHDCENSLLLLDSARQACGFYETLRGSRSDFQNQPKNLTLDDLQG